MLMLLVFSKPFINTCFNYPCVRQIMNAFENATTSIKELPTARANAFLSRSIFFNFFSSKSHVVKSLLMIPFLVREHKPNVLI